MHHIHLQLYSTSNQKGENYELFEYPTMGNQISTVVIDVKGRFPLQGWVSNSISTMSCYILRGRGRIHIKNGDEIISREFNNTDVIIVLPNEVYFWEPITDSFQMCVSSAPAWTREQQLQIPD